MYRKALLATVAFGLLSAIAFGIVSATPPPPPDATPTATPTVAPQSEDRYPFDFLIAVLTDAYENDVLPDELSDLLADLLIENLIAPVTGETLNEIKARLSTQDPFDLLIAVITDARDRATLNDALNNLLSDLLIEYLIVPVTGETPEEAEQRLSEELLPESVSVELPAGWSGFLNHPSGARIEVSHRTTDEAATVEIAEVQLPDSAAWDPAGGVFDFSVGDETLDKPVTLRIPYELEAGQDAQTIVVMHRNENTNAWEEIGGTVDETTQTVEVSTSDLSLLTAIFGGSRPGLLVCDNFQSSAECLANRFAPALKMHPDERFMPRDVRGFVAQAGNGNIRVDDLDDFEKYDDNFTLDVPDDIRDSTAYPPTVYWTIQTNGALGQVYVQYYLFYYYDYLNPLQSRVCSLLDEAAAQDTDITIAGVIIDVSRFPGWIHDSFCHPHEADWELIQLGFQGSPFTNAADRLDDIVAGRDTPGTVTYSQHGWSSVRLYSIVQRIGSHPVAYVALGKHANYPSPPFVTEYVGKVHDQIAVHGRLLEPPARSSSGYRLEGISESTPWVAYTGKWGESKISGPDEPTRWNKPHLWDSATVLGEITSENLSILGIIFQFVETNTAELVPDPEQPPLPPTSGIRPPQEQDTEERIDAQIEVLRSEGITVKVGEDAQAQVKITNTGTVTTTFDMEAWLTLDGEDQRRLDLQRVELSPGISETLDVPFTGDTVDEFGLSVRVYRVVLRDRSLMLRNHYEDYFRVLETVKLSDLYLRLSASGDVDAGQPLTYTIRVKNEGPDKAGSVMVRMSLAGEVLLSPFSKTDDINGCEVDTTITCDFGTVDRGETERGDVTVKVPVDAAGLVINRAYVFMDNKKRADPNSANSRASVTTSVNPASRHTPTPTPTSTPARDVPTPTPTVTPTPRPRSEALTANAGRDQYVRSGDLVTLDGRDSTSGAGVTYRWSNRIGIGCLTEPCTNEVTRIAQSVILSDYASPVTTFTAPELPGRSTELQMSFVLFVERDGSSVYDQVSVYVTPNTPIVAPSPTPTPTPTVTPTPRPRSEALIANAGPDRYVRSGDLVTLNGRGSTSGAGVTYRWSNRIGIGCLAEPCTDEVTRIAQSVILSDYASPVTTFTAPELPGRSTELQMSFVLFVERDGSSVYDQVNVYVTPNTPAASPTPTPTPTATPTPAPRTPVADAGSDQYSVQPGSTVTLDGSGSSPGMTYSWRLGGMSAIVGCQGQSPCPPEYVRNAVVLSNPSSQSPTFVVPELRGGLTALQLSFVLTVVSSEGLSAQDDVSIYVNWSR